MLRSDLDDRPRIDPDDVRELIGGIVFLALLALGLSINVIVN